MKEYGVPKKIVKECHDQAWVSKYIELIDQKNKVG